ncbi:MAG: ATP synthase alpha chain [Candidatus Bipolaricaulis sibiricus]|uniref:ATP synthase subunit alpha n=1 Tax=Bipolaricaulis sibiricus TaxID=2501609 RepID=A0A410FTK0_BIPS1|nr:MAG: ATP synthase alpha chain [Candidatus Bipolaricaulis sibiricus]
MNARKDEIAAIIKKQIQQLDIDLQMEEVGVVVEVGDGIARVWGLRSAMASELLRFPGEVHGLVLDLAEDSVGVAILGPDRGIREGDEVRRTGHVLSTPVGKGFLGRVVDPLGAPLDGGGVIEPDGYRKTDDKAPGVIARQPVNTPLQTGIKCIDALTPIGRGQRELLIGDRRTGKTAVALDTIIHQKGQNVYCIYVAIGQKSSTIAKAVDALRRHGALEYTIIVAAAAEDPTPLQYIAPYAGCAMGEYFRDRGEDALVIYDDLSKHAVAYREISLLLRRPPGREAYPGDIFYTHSRLLERAARMNDEHGGGSLTALPIVETKAGDITAYISTNLISITDGQIYLEADLFNKGQRPAMNVGLSVSRVGGAAQIPAMKEVAGQLRLELAQYRDLAAFAEFAQELDEASQAQLARGARVMEVLNQDQYQPLPVESQVVVLYAAVGGHLDDVPVEGVRAFEHGFLAFVAEHHPNLLPTLRAERRLTDALRDELDAALVRFREGFRV